MKKMICMALALLLLPLTTLAIESPAYTYTLDYYYNLIRTQDAYMPGSVMLRELNMKSPEDLFLLGHTLYIADTGNGRILRYDMDSGWVTEIGKGVLQQPTGVCADAQGKVYVADYKAQAVVIFDAAGQELQRITRPDSVLYGAKSAYKPQKIVLDSYGNIYVTSEGTHEGILQFDARGVFAGFFGANRVASLKLIDRITDVLFTQEQKDKQPRRNPSRIVNLDVSTENLVFSLSQFSPKDAIKQLNMAGINVMYARNLYASDNVVDVAVAPDGVFYTITDTGSIGEYDVNGFYLFFFGGRAISSDRNGLTSVVSAICVDADHNLYVLDKQRGIVQPYAATDFARQVHAGLLLYSQGRYSEAADIWQDYIRLTPTSRFAHAGYGMALWQMGDYQQAYGELCQANEMDYASEAYWELRNLWLMENLSAILVVLFCLCVMAYTLAWLQKKKRVFSPFKAWWKQHISKTVVMRAFATMRSIIRHPMDTLYDIKHNTQGSLASAGILYLLALLVYMLDLAFTAPLFNSGVLNVPGSNPYMIAAIAAVPALLFVIGNYFIASINDGEGSMRHVATAMGYALSFYILCSPLITLLSYALTFNEQFIIVLLRVVVYGYTVVLIYLAAKEIHGYSAGQTLKNLLLTICFVGLALLAMAILYLLWHELIGFIQTLTEEVRLRA